MNSTYHCTVPAVHIPSEGLVGSILLAVAEVATADLVDLADTAVDNSHHLVGYQLAERAQVLAN